MVGAVGLLSGGIDRIDDRFVYGASGGRFGIDHLSRVDDRRNDDGLIVHERFEVLRGSDLWVSIVQHFVEKFIKEDEVLPYGFLGKCAAVVLEDFGDFGEKLLEEWATNGWGRSSCSQQITIMGEQVDVVSGR